MANHNGRPTSPHLQVYRLPLTGIISITHRITGVFLSFGLVLVVGLIVSLVSGAQAFDSLQSIFGTWPVQAVYYGFIYALFFHLCHGVRHLFWDAGLGFDLDSLNRFALIELLCSLVLTLLTLIFI